MKGFFLGLFYAHFCFGADHLAVQAEWSALLLTIEAKVAVLKEHLSHAGVAYDTGDLDRLWKKIGPQSRLKDRPLVVMMLGQHNSGKSTVLKLMAGDVGEDHLSLVSDTGGSTTGPVALLPLSFPEKDLAFLFPGFTLKKIRSATDATLPVPEGTTRLLWSTHPLMPPSIALVDSPDLDSYHLENAVQTRAMVDVADVIAVMITDQYANRDVVNALREVAAAQKPVIFIFNKADLENDSKLWAKRVAELRKVTNVDILDTFVIENNPARARAGESLDFYRVGQSADETPAQRPPLDAVLDLNVTTIRIQTELGALEQALNAESGLEAFVRRIAEINAALASLRTLFDETERSPGIGDWPEMPVQAVGQTILETWSKHHRTTTTSFLRKVPFWIKRAYGALMEYAYRAKITEQERDYRQKEFEYLRDQVIRMVLRELQVLRTSGKATGKLAQVVDGILDPERISEMQSQLQAAHENMRLVDSDLEAAIQKELDRLRDEHPNLYSTLQNADTILAALELVGPVAMGFGAGYLLQAPLLSNVATSLIAGPVQTAAGVAAWSSATPAVAATGDKVRNFALRQSFENIVRQYGTYRITWVMNWLRENYLGAFYEELSKTSEATGAEEVQQLRDAISCARQLQNRIRSAGDFQKKD